MNCYSVVLASTDLKDRNTTVVKFYASTPEQALENARVWIKETCDGEVVVKDIWNHDMSQLLISFLNGKRIHEWPEGGGTCKLCGRTSSEELEHQNKTYYSNRENNKKESLFTECPGPLDRKQTGALLTKRVDEGLELIIRTLVKDIPGITRSDVVAEIAYIAGYKFKNEV